MPAKSGQPGARSFSDLTVWVKAHQFVLEAYKLTSSFPQREMFGLSAQLRRAAVSIPANVAEGFKRRGKAEKLRFLNIAEGSIAECRYYLMLTTDLGYARTAATMSLLEEVSRLITAYSAAIRSSIF